MDRSGGWLDHLQELSISRDANILSVDVEGWPGRSCVEDTLYLLDLFRRKGARATFFVLGTVASSEPDLVRRIVAEGHEVGSHGWNHLPLSRKTPGEFRGETLRSFDTLSALAGGPIAGFRAPYFGVNARTSWALELLSDAGFAYDSSIFPIAGPRYGVPEFPRAPVRIGLGGRSIVEVPLSTVRALGRNVPVAGGGYFRLLPYPVIERAVRAVNDDGLPFVVYCHPYEFGREPLPRPPGDGVLGSMRAAITAARFNLLRGTMRGKLARLLDAFRFTSFREALRQWDAAAWPAASTACAGAETGSVCPRAAGTTA